MDLNDSSLSLSIEFSKELFLYEMFYFQAVFPFRGLYDVIDILVNDVK